MNARYQILFLLVLLTAFTWSCEEAFERRLEGHSVALIGPQNGIATSTGIQTFLWSTLDGASNYRLQIVSPSFDSIQYLIVDTTVGNDNFALLLDPGSYQWKVRAQNSSSYTDFTVPFTLTVK